MMSPDFDDFSDILRDIDQRQDVTVTIWQGMLTILLVAFMLTIPNDSYWETLLSVSATGTRCLSLGFLTSLSSAASMSEKPSAEARERSVRPS